MRLNVWIIVIIIQFCWLNGKQKIHHVCFWESVFESVFNIWAFSVPHSPLTSVSGLFDWFKSCFSKRCATRNCIQGHMKIGVQGKVGKSRVGSGSISSNNYTATEWLWKCLLIFLVMMSKVFCQWKNNANIQCKQ